MYSTNFQQILKSCFSATEMQKPVSTTTRQEISDLPSRWVADSDKWWHALMHRIILVLLQRVTASEVKEREGWASKICSPVLNGTSLNVLSTNLMSLRQETFYKLSKHQQYFQAITMFGLPFSTNEIITGKLIKLQIIIFSLWFNSIQNKIT